MLLLLLVLSLSVAAGEASIDAGGKRIVLIGGQKSHGPGEHDFANGLGAIKQALLGATNVHGLSVEIYPDAWPADSSILAGASTIVWYFDGIQQVPHPLLNADRRAAFAKLMEQGVGFVCLHQATSLPADNTSIPLTDWLGGCRYGMIDRANLDLPFTQEHADSPVCHGWTSFSYKDEIYPTLAFVAGSKGVTPLLSAVAPPEKPAPHTVAWTYDRPGGGRSFGFTGLHYVTSMRVDPVRHLVLNGILWTAHIDIPANGVESPILPAGK
jgi:type 1 glutamine amidotransferase